MKDKTESNSAKTKVRKLLSAVLGTVIWKFHATSTVLIHSCYYHSLCLACSYNVCCWWKWRDQISSLLFPLIINIHTFILKKNNPQNSIVILSIDYSIVYSLWVLKFKQNQLIPLWNLSVELSQKSCVIKEEKETQMILFSQIAI